MKPGKSCPMENHAPELCILDCDGVLFDSHRANLAFFNQCLDLSSLPPVSPELEDQVRYLSVSQLAELVIGSGEKARDLTEFCRSRPYEPFVPLIEPLFDFDRFFSDFQDAPFFALASNRGNSLKTIISSFKLDRYITFSVSTMEAPPKPDPAMLHMCCEYFGISPEKAIFVGDAPTDEEAAERAGIPFLFYDMNLDASPVSLISKRLAGKTA